MLKVAFYTLGCKVNYYETEALKALFRSRGYRVVDFNQVADVYVVNTCTVTHLSDRKSRQMIRKAKRRNSAAVVAVTGCYGQVYSERLEEVPEADLITGTHGRRRLPDLVEKIRRGEAARVEVESFGPHPEFEKLPFCEEQGRTRAFLKVQEGCNQRCSYCVVPLARGPIRSRPLEEVMEEVQRIAAKGYREIVFTGIRLGLFGAEQNGASLADLIKRTEEVEGIWRLRLSSIEPTDFNKELIHAITHSKKVCRHLHIPLQSGDDEILQRMNRPYNSAEFTFLLGRLRSLMPGLAVSTDLLVGFPGETSEHHRRSMEVVERLQFSRMHIFKYSPRMGTPAYDLSGKVPPPEQEKRRLEMEELATRMAGEFRRRFLKTRQWVLVEKTGEQGEGRLEGFTQHYLRVRAKIRGKVVPRGSLVAVNLQEDLPQEECLWGAVEESPGEEEKEGIISV